MIKVGDRITPKKDSEIYKEMKGYNLEFEIVEITDSLIKVKNECGFEPLAFGYGIMSMNELSQFDIIEKKKEEWSEWNYHPDISSFCYKIYYKTKGRKTHVILHSTFDETTSTGKSVAHKEDKYNFEKGIEVALADAFKNRVNNRTQPINRTLKVNKGLKECMIEWSLWTGEE